MAGGPIVNRVAERLNSVKHQKSYLYLPLDIIKFISRKWRFSALSSPVAKLTFVPQDLLIIFNGSPHVFEAIFKGPFPQQLHGRKK